MTADSWRDAVRRQVALGRLVPLGGPGDGAWIAESAAVAVLVRAVADKAPRVRLGTVRIALDDPHEAAESAVPAPPGALPPGALRVTADFAVTADFTSPAGFAEPADFTRPADSAATGAEPLPVVASRVRLTLAAAAAERLGLVVTAVDLRVTDLLEADDATGPAVRAQRPASAREATDPQEARVAAAALSVPGVVALTGALGGLGRAVHLEERTTPAALPHRHVRVELAVSADHRTVEVARRVRAVVQDALEDRPTVAVLVTSVS
ncbi:nucleopolyhedrovirus P10 family protein [Streptomyces sp. NPDC048514]|uniref:nucleopolyhedrovirus P10 family protein n=1 Tax=Streptomyces sp. NPDC048514 TaxID=3365564 RepID=UPI00371BB13D